MKDYNNITERIKDLFGSKEEYNKFAYEWIKVCHKLNHNPQNKDLSKIIITYR